MATMYKIERVADKTFNFQPPNSDTVYEVPVLSQLPISQLVKIRKFYKRMEDGVEDLDVFDLLEFLNEIFEPYAPGVVDSLKAEEAAFLFKAYQDASNEDGLSVSPVGE